MNVYRTEPGSFENFHGKDLSVRSDHRYIRFSFIKFIKEFLVAFYSLRLDHSYAVFQGNFLNWRILYFLSAALLLVRLSDAKRDIMSGLDQTF